MLLSIFVEKGRTRRKFARAVKGAAATRRKPSKAVGGDAATRRNLSKAAERK